MATLNTRTSVLGVMNPRNQYDGRRTMEECTGLGGPLLSRFDIILPLQDSRNPAWDETVAGHILNTHAQGVSRVKCY